MFRSGWPRFNLPVRSVVFWCWAGSLSAVLVGAVGLRFHREWVTGGESGSTTIRNIGLSLAALIAFPLAIWRSRVAERQADTAQQALLGDRYEKAADMLGSDRLATRLGGIYALQTFATEHPYRYHVQVMRLLCAYVQDPVRYGVHNPERLAVDVRTSVNIQPYPIPEDIAATIEILRLRNDAQLEVERGAQLRLDLHGAILRGARLDNTELRGALFWDADLSSAPEEVINVTRLDGADLTRANLVRADLSNANLAGAVLKNAELARANLKGAKLQTADLTGASLAAADISGAVFGDRGCRLDRNGNTVTTKLSQRQLNNACADAANPPQLEGLTDRVTGELLVWRGHRCDTTI